MRKARKKPAHFVGGKLPWPLYLSVERKLRANRLTWRRFITTACEQYLKVSAKK